MKLFVAALGASSYIYAEARASEGLADWIGCHVGLFAYTLPRLTPRAFACRVIDRP